MILTGQRRMVDSINDLTGADDCTRALSLHERPRWAALVALGLVAAGMGLTLAFEPTRQLTGQLVVLAIVMPLGLIGKRWVLARSGMSVVLAESSRFRPKATRIVAVAEAPIDQVPSGGLITKWFDLFGRRFRIPRLYHGELRRILG